MFARVVAAVVLVAAALALLAAAWPQLVGLERTLPVAQAVSLRGLSAAAALVAALLLGLIALVARAARRFAGSLALLLVLFVLVNAAVLGTRGAGGAEPEAEQPGDVTVLSWNTLGDAPGPERIAQLALESGADVVALPETTRATAERVAVLMRDAGSPMWVHTEAFDEVSPARSTSLLTSVDLGTYSIDPGAGQTRVLPSVVLVPDDGEGPAIAAVHPVAPIPEFMDEWSADLDWVAGLCARDDLIVAGDFNATLDHFERGDGDLNGCRDAAASTGWGAVGTWPTSLPALLGAPIDHVLATDGWQAVSTRVIESADDDGSDHRPIVATLRPAD